MVLLLQKDQLGSLCAFKWWLSWTRRFKNSLICCWLGYLLPSLGGFSLHVVSLETLLHKAQGSKSVKAETTRPSFHHLLLVKMNYKASSDGREGKWISILKRRALCCTEKGKFEGHLSITVHPLATSLVPPTCQIYSPCTLKPHPSWHMFKISILSSKLDPVMAEMPQVLFLRCGYLGVASLSPGF